MLCLFSHFIPWLSWLLWELGMFRIWLYILLTGDSLLSWHACSILCMCRTQLAGWNSCCTTCFITCQAWIAGSGTQTTAWEKAVQKRWKKNHQINDSSNEKLRKWEILNTLSLKCKISSEVFTQMRAVLTPLYPIPTTSIRPGTTGSLSIACMVSSKLPWVSLGLI